MTARALRRPTPAQILAARVAMKADRMLGDKTPADIREMAEMRLPHEADPDA